MEKEILELLKDGKALNLIEISDSLGYTKEMDEMLANTLADMVSKYDLCLTNKNRYMLFELNEKNRNYVKGKFMDTKGDAAFVRVDGMEDDIHISGNKTGGALNGDTVLVYIIKPAKRDFKAEGEVVKIIDRSVSNKVGEVYHYEGKTMVSLDDKKFKKLIYLPDTPEVRRLVDGDKVVVSFLGSRTDRDYINATFVKRIGNIHEPGVDILSIVADHEINVEFPEEVLEELKKVPTEVGNDDLSGRHDLRNEMIFTIDGDDTRDIDDGISLKKIANGNYELGVHIADVSHYVKEGSALDLEARNRGTSTYLVDRVIPMYPPQLSNGICSLNPNVDRLTISCIMEIDNNGKMVNYDIFPSVIHSNIQMTYNKVNDILEKGNIPSGYEKYAKTLLEMNKLAHIIRDERTRRGAIDFDTDEAKIIADSEGKPIDVVLRERGEGEKLIEDFMVRANETVASHFFYMDLPSLYRIHGMPDEDKLRKFLQVLNALGINLHADLGKMNAKVIQKIVNELKTYPEFRVLATKLLSCMDKAIYSPENIGHFALASKIYTHFTSPIRRYPDTTVHRLLHNYFFSKDGITEEKIKHFKEILSDIAIHSSEMERNSDDCERDVDDMKMAEYMSYHIDEEFTGMISGVTNNGFYVQLDNMIEGMVKIDSLLNQKNLNFDFDKDREILKVGKNIFKLGDLVRVRVTRASKEDSEIDFAYVGDVDEKEERKKI